VRGLIALGTALAFSALLALAACNQILGVTTFTSGDGGSGSNLPCISTMFPFQACFEPTASVMLPATIETDPCTAGVIASQGTGNPDVCVIGGSAITISNGESIRAQGSNVLALVAANTIEIDGILDVSGVGERGPGGNQLSCIGIGSAAGQGGGGGGGFAVAGAAGGSGSGGAGALGGEDETGTMILRGGCDGGAGGGTGGGSGGLSGGGVLLFAPSITVTGTVSASGGGGNGGTGGGGGGATGGLIAVQNTSPDIEGSLLACGGGGGAGGGAGVSGGSGQPGFADGGGGGAGSPTTGGGAGGTGGGTANPTAGSAGAMSGGGGGGAYGVVLVDGDLSSATLCPPLT
jgi:hypothetical protein